MKQSFAVDSFWNCYKTLPKKQKKLARKQYALWLNEPSYPSLSFKRISSSEPIFSIRISKSYRALALKESDVYYWFWIGNHDDYERLIKTY